MENAKFCAKYQITQSMVRPDVKLQSKTEDRLKVLNDTSNNCSIGGDKESLKGRLFLLSDNGCHPTPQHFMMDCSLLGIKQIFTTGLPPRIILMPNGFHSRKILLKSPHEWSNLFDFLRYSLE
jgi:hypothetical protein